MSIGIGDNFNYQGSKFNMDRDSFQTKEAMKSYPETSLPPKGFRAYCAEDDEYYEFNAENSVDPETGKWRMVDNPTAKKTVEDAKTNGDYAKEQGDAAKEAARKVTNDVLFKVFQSLTEEEQTQVKQNIGIGVEQKFQGQFESYSELEGVSSPAVGDYAYVGNPRNLYAYKSSGWVNLGAFNYDIDQELDADSERGIANRVVTKTLSYTVYTDSAECNKVIKKLFIDKSGYIGDYSIDDLRVNIISRGSSNMWGIQIRNSENELISSTWYKEEINSAKITEKNGLFVYVEYDWSSINTGSTVGSNSVKILPLAFNPINDPRNSIGTDEISDNAIISNKIANGAVTNNKIKNESIDIDKIMYIDGKNRKFSSSLLYNFLGAEGDDSTSDLWPQQIASTYTQLNVQIVSVSDSPIYCRYGRRFTIPDIKIPETNDYYLSPYNIGLKLKDIGLNRRFLTVSFFLQINAEITAQISTNIGFIINGTNLVMTVPWKTVKSDRFYVKEEVKTLNGNNKSSDVTINFTGKLISNDWVFVVVQCNISNPDILPLNSAQFILGFCGGKDSIGKSADSCGWSITGTNINPIRHLPDTQFSPFAIDNSILGLFNQEIYTSNYIINKTVRKLFIDKSGYTGSENIDELFVSILAKNANNFWGLQFRNSEGTTIASCWSGKEDSIIEKTIDGIYYYIEFDWGTISEGQHDFSPITKVTSLAFNPINDPRKKGEIADGAVTNNKIADGAVTKEKLGFTLSGCDTVLTNMFYGSAGDSLTEGAGLDAILDNDDPYLPKSGTKKATYAYYIAKLNHCKWANYGKSGSTLGDVTAAGSDKNGFSKENGRYTQMDSDLTHISIWFGWNDSAYGPRMKREEWLQSTYSQKIYWPATPDLIGTVHSDGTPYASQEQYEACSAVTGKVNNIQYDNNDDYFNALYIGTPDDATNKTFWGAYNIVLPYLINKYPLAKILIIVSFGCTQLMRECTRNAAKKYGLATFDFSDINYQVFRQWEDDQADGRINGNTVKKFRTDRLTSDGLHPNNDGYKYMYPSINSRLLSI